MISCQQIEAKFLIIKVLSLLVIVLNIYLYKLNDNENDVSHRCPIGYFRIGRMRNCHQLLDCSDYKDMSYKRVLSRGLVKIIYLVQWNDNYLIASNLSDTQYESDFGHNIEMLRHLSDNSLIVQLIGWCHNNVLFTEYHPKGDANNLPHLLTHQMSEYNNISVKLNLCVNYVKILQYLHNSPIGIRVMCDSNSLQKTLSQYLLTNELTLVLNDLDALPQVIPHHNGVKCGPRQLFGSYVAPEQLWHKNEPFSDQLMPEYDHKTDIWKIPDVCEWFLKSATDPQSASMVLKDLSDIHNQCKHIDPQHRPTAEQVLQVYSTIYISTISL